MSTVKVNEVRHLSNTGTANLVLESNATTNLQATSTLGLTVTGTLTVSGVSTFNGNMVVGNATTDTVDLQSKVTGFNNFSGFTGEIRMYAGNAAGDDPPTGWLYCNGDTISSTINDGGTNLGGTHYNADGKGNNYQPLFNLLKAASDWGNTSSASWGTDKVKVPDFRSRSPVGIATGAANAADARSTGTALASGLTSRTIGDTAGTETHALTVAELAVHTHASTIVASSTGQTISTITASSHSHTSAGHSHAMAHTHNIATTETATTSSGSPHSHQSSVEGGTDFSQSGGLNGGDNSSLWHNTATENSHTHYFNVPAHATQGVSTSNTSSTTPSATGNTTPSISGGALTDPTHTHTLTAVNAAHSGVSAAGTAHTNLSPIIAVNYIIKV